MSYDVIIIGAGPAGLAFACALKGTGLNVVMIEKSSLDTLKSPAEDGREIALTHLSVRLMQDMGAWERLDADFISPIKVAKVFNGDSPYSLDFTRPVQSMKALGYLVPNHLIRQSFYEEVATLGNVNILTDTVVEKVSCEDQAASVMLSSGETLSAPLIVSADSRFSETRRQMGVGAHMKDFSRTAIVCRMEHELSHQQTAFECFHYGRTMALLPMNGNLSSVVITIDNQKASELIAMSDTVFNTQIQQWFGDKLGAMSLIGRRHSYPLVAVHADRFTSRRFAVVGDAAVGMHPVTAHGFNLGIRGADVLAAEMKKAIENGRDFSDASVLQSYEKDHMQVSKFLYHGTNSVVGLFTNETVPAKFARDALLRLANNFPPVKTMITRKLTDAETAGGRTLLPPFPPLPSRRFLPFSR